MRDSSASHGAQPVRVMPDVPRPLARSLPFMTGRRILLLQGPVGGFFDRLARALEANGNNVTKVNFNGGDWFWFRRGLAYRGRPKSWPAFLADLMTNQRIDLMLMFSDCRPIHVAAGAVASRLGVEVGVFEEGYIRPDQVTLERDGVNANSRTDFLAGTGPGARTDMPPAREMGNTFPGKAIGSFWYFLVGILGVPFFWHYRHHKALWPRQGLWWVRAGLRKLMSQRRDRLFMDRITGDLKGRFYLVPLQVYDDYQIIAHSDYADVRDFIDEVIRSFAAHAPQDMQLVFKHHPMDRGYRHYGKMIGQIAARVGAGARVHYYHDLHLPTAISAARGIVVVNSTVGLDSIWLGRPTYATGRAFYAMHGLVCQGALDDFWRDCDGAVPDRRLVLAVRRNILIQTQMNGSFYRTASPIGGDEPGFAGLAEPDPSSAD